MMYRMSIAALATTLMCTGLLLAGEITSVLAAQRGPRGEAAPSVEQPDLNLPSLIQPDIEEQQPVQRPPREVIEIQPGMRDQLRIEMGDCTRGFFSGPDPTDGHKYICTTGMATGPFACAEPFEVRPGSHTVKQGKKAFYICEATPNALPPASGVCKLPFTAEKLVDKDHVTVYRCTSWNTTCTGSWSYIWNSVAYLSNIGRFEYVCQY